MPPGSPLQGQAIRLEIAGWRPGDYAGLVCPADHDLIATADRPSLLHRILRGLRWWS